MKYLNQLLEEGVITGYNMYDFRLEDTCPHKLILRNMHETSNYLINIVKDLNKLGHPLPQVSIQFRYRYTNYLVKPDFLIRDEEGKPFPYLKIKKDEKEIDLKNAKNLRELGYNNDLTKKLIAENKAYEIVINSFDKKILTNLAVLFSEKARNQNKDHWVDAYDTPIILVQGLNKLEAYKPICLYQKRLVKGEVDFVIGELEAIIHKNLLKKGFKRKICLINSTFSYD